jgi:hypothetical protein
MVLTQQSVKTEFDHKLLEAEVSTCSSTTPIRFSLKEWDQRLAVSRMHSAFNGATNDSSLLLKHTMFSPPYVLDCVRKTLLDDKALNTDWRKRKDDIIESLISENEGDIDPLGIDVYATIDCLVSQSKEKIALFAKAIGCHLPSSASKPSAIAMIQSHIMRAKGINSAEFNKFFPTWKKTTGGIMALLCSHGIVYYFKSLIGGEGTGDAGDAMLTVDSTIYVYDAIGSVVNHLNKRLPSFFGCNKGLPVSNTGDNILLMKKVVSNSASIAKRFEGLVHIDDLKKLPNRIALCDPLHITNSKSEVDRYLRRIEIVSGLGNRLNTMPQEHVWKRTLQLAHSINNMTYDT